MVEMSPYVVAWTVVSRSLLLWRKSSATSGDRGSSGWLLLGQARLKMWVAVLGDTGGCSCVASSRAALRAKEGGLCMTSMVVKVGGSTLTKCGGASSSSRRLEMEDAGDSLEGSWDPSADITYQWLGQYSSLQAKAAETACAWVTWRRSVGYKRSGS